MLPTIKVRKDMPVPPLILSSDSHVFEPPDLWQTRIDAAFRDRAPRIERIGGADQIVGSVSSRTPARGSPPALHHGLHVPRAPRRGIYRFKDGMLPSEFLRCPKRAAAIASSRMRPLTGPTSSFFGHPAGRKDVMLLDTVAKETEYKSGILRSVGFRHGHWLRIGPFRPRNVPYDVESSSPYS